MSQRYLIDNKLIYMNWRFGMPPYIFWNNYRELIEESIAKFKLKPLEINIEVSNREFAKREFNEGGLTPYSLVANEEPMMLKRIVLPGGILNPHFHFDGKIYLLEKKQWSEFSNSIVKDFKMKLDKARNVDFEKVMHLSEAIQNLG